MERSEIIKQLFEVENWSISDLSRKFSHSRNTIKRYISGKNADYERTKEYERPQGDLIKEIVEQWYKDDLSGPRKQRRTGQKIYDDLKKDYGYEGSYSTVKRILRGVRGKAKEVYIPRDHQPGEYSEFDFGYAKVKVGGLEIKLAIHCYQLTYSNDIFAYTSIRETQEELFESHKLSFEHFDGVSQKIRYDNLKQVVKKVLRGSRREEQESFQTFREQFGFEAEFCEVAKGNQKGDVEGCVGYVRRNFFSPVPDFETIEILNKELALWCKSLRKKRKVYGTDQTVEQHYLKEKFHFLIPPKSSRVIGKRKIGKVSHYSLVCIDHCYYSVPTQYAYEYVDVVMGAREIVIYHKTIEIACHQRCFEKGKQVFDPSHYIPVFMKKPHTLLNSKPIKELPDVFRRFFEKAYHKGNSTVRECVRILELLKTSPISDLEVAIELSMTYQTYHYDGVKNILDQLLKGNQSIEKLHITNPRLKIEIPKVDLKRYNALISEGDN